MFQYFEQSPSHLSLQHIQCVTYLLAFRSRLTYLILQGFSFLDISQGPRTTPLLVSYFLDYKYIHTFDPTLPYPNSCLIATALLILKNLKSLLDIDWEASTGLADGGFISCSLLVSALHCFLTLTWIQLAQDCGRCLRQPPLDSQAKQRSTPLPTNNKMVYLIFISTFWWHPSTVSLCTSF